MSKQRGRLVMALGPDTNTRPPIPPCIGCGSNRAPGEYWWRGDTQPSVWYHDPCFITALAQGTIKAHSIADPPLTFSLWRKDERA